MADDTNATPPATPGGAPTNAPTNKVIAAATAAAVVTIVVWAANQFAHVAIPDYVQGALTTLVTFVSGYWMPERG
jgi:hypothetical protein